MWTRISDGYIEATVVLVEVTPAAAAQTFTTHVLLTLSVFLAP